MRRCCIIYNEPLAGALADELPPRSCVPRHGADPRGPRSLDQGPRCARGQRCRSRRGAGAAGDRRTEARSTGRKSRAIGGSSCTPAICLPGRRAYSDDQEPVTVHAEVAFALNGERRLNRFDALDFRPEEG